MRENCTSGTARGALGNRRSYRGGALALTEYAPSAIKFKNKLDLEIKLFAGERF